MQRVVHKRASSRALVGVWSLKTMMVSKGITTQKPAYAPSVKHRVCLVYWRAPLKGCPVASPKTSP